MNPLRVVKDDKELYNHYRDSLRERSRVAISIHGATDEHRIHIERALQELLTAEVIKLAHDDLRAGGVSGELLDEHGLRSSLEGVRLPERDRTILESKVRRLARRMMMPKDDTDGGKDPGEVGRPTPSRPSSPALGTFEQHLSGPICLCAVTSMPGTMMSLSGVLTTPPTASTPINIAIILQIDNIWGRVGSGDLLSLKVEAGSSFGIASNQMQVGLASAVSWAKEIYAYNCCMGKLASVHQDGPNPAPSFMLLMNECGGADTIVFTKPQFGGVWADVSNFEPSRFWSVFGGMRLTFNWLKD